MQSWEEKKSYQPQTSEQKKKYFKGKCNHIQNVKLIVPILFVVVVVVYHPVLISVKIKGHMKNHLGFPRYAFA